jgi:hypothetical protein
MDFQITGLGKLDAIELEKILGKAAKRAPEPQGSGGRMQEIGTATLLLVMLAPDVLAAIIAWLAKRGHRRKTKIKLRKITKDGVEELEVESSDVSADGIDSRTVEKLAGMSKLSVPALKEAITKELRKSDGK